MANIKSSQKRIKIAERNRQKNKSYDSKAKTFRKKFDAAIQAYRKDPASITLEEIEQQQREVFSNIDKAVKKKVYHKNKGARLKSQISKALADLLKFTDGESADNPRPSSSLPGDDTSTYPTKEEKEKYLEEENQENEAED